MADNIGKVDAPAVARAKAAGAIFIGKTTTSEFGCKPVGDSPLTGDHAQSSEPLAHARRIERRLRGLGGRRDHPFCVGHRWRRFDPHPRRFYRHLRHQGELWSRAGLAHLGDAHAGVMSARWREPCRTPPLLLQTISGYETRDPASIAAAGSRLCRRMRGAVGPVAHRLEPDARLRDSRKPRWCASVRRRRSGSRRPAALVEEVDRVFAADPEDIWTAEFYAGVGTRLRPILENRPDLLDPAVATILRTALAARHAQLL